ncbi:saga complex component [Niveomyces insectorum RCEF 264]|uniref:Saga complex component n=1 Tax=Niveomyces insectorum RCEF 264 TaxID=1081102 RepID=A0A162I9I9_9HYPO|nr:saga complex component [Niveomyces insectorum RCEF 264]
MSDARNGLSSSPAPAATKSTPKQKAGEEATIKVASKKDGKDGGGGSAAKARGGIIKLKKPPPKHKQPGNWKEGAFVDQDKKRISKQNIPAPSPSPVVNQLDETARETFATGRPLEDTPDLQMCKHCKKSVLSTAAKQHIAACLKLKKEKAQRKKEAKEARERAREQQAREEEEAARRAEGGGDKGDDGSSDSEDGGGGGGANEKKAAGGGGPVHLTGKGGKKAAAAASKKAEAAAAAAASAAADAKGAKKRKADSELDKTAPKKKKKEEAKAKAAKPKGPVDVERQCGVLLPNGQPCARSLTCKSHSMGAKRAVPGRSLPYDMLLAAYQKKNQAKQQKAAIDATAHVVEEDDANGGIVDSDEETAAVMNALANWRPQPVVPQPVFGPIRRQYQLARLHEQLHTATNGGRVNIFSVVGFGAQKLPEGHPGLLDCEDALGESDTEAMVMMPPAAPAAAPLPAVTSTTPIPPPATPSSSSSPPPPSSATAVIMRNHSSPATQRPVTVSSRA